jgi:hypothetical protein
MSGTSAQGMGVCLLLAGFVLLAAGLAAGGGVLVVSLLGACTVGVSCVLLAKAKRTSTEE